MRKEFEALYKSLEGSLSAINPGGPTIVGYARSIDLIRTKIAELRALAGNLNRDKAAEIEYFRRVWPLFYGKLFLYIRMHQFEMNRQSLPAEMAPDLIRREERAIRVFFREHGEFSLYFASGSPVIDELFTRQYSMNRTFDELSLVIDPEGGTVASYRAAWCLAYTGYKTFLEKELDSLLHPGNQDPGADPDYEWAATDADAVEWLYGIHASKAVRYKGQPADIAHLVRLFRLNFRKDIVNVYDRFKALRNRKKDRAPFTRKMLNALEKRMDEADGKFE
jgi:hypothetical protein